jgi:twitching motility protein PilT
MTFDIDSFLRRAIETGGSDIHLTVNERPMLRIGGRIVKIDMPEFTLEDIKDIIEKLSPAIFKDKIHSFHDIDFSYELKNVSRFRVNIAYQMEYPKLTIRVIPYNVKSPTELGLPSYVEKFIDAKSGLVVVTGKTGSGKSTTLASLINEINKKYQKHIITLEDPVEFIYTNRKSIVTQRQVGIDTESFSDGVKYALRQDPDVILVGEIRDADSVRHALLAAETGLLVFATLHTKDSIQTISRIINMFEPEFRENVREEIAEVLVGVISQKLVVGKDKRQRHLACEIMVNTPTIKDLIQKGKTDEIYNFLKGSSFENMTTINNSLYDLLQKDLITEEEAISMSENKIELQQMIKGVFVGTKK